MKKTKNMLWVLGLMLMCLSCYDDTELLNRIDALEKAQISTVNNVDEQVKAIKSSIASLTDLQNSLKEQLAALESQYEALQVAGTEQDSRLSELEKDVMNLTNMVQQIAVMIDSLRSTVNELLAEQKSWAEATFATLEQHNALCDVLATTKVSLGDMMKDYDEANVAKFAALAGQVQTVETSLKAWVSDQLVNYYDIATMDAKLKALEAAMGKGDDALKKELTALAASAEAMKQELTAAYQSAIKTAIEENNGTITKQIAKEIAAVNDRTDKAVAELNVRMTALENRVDALEKQMTELMKQLDIIFDETNVAYFPGSIVQIHYTLINADEETTVEAIADAGWKAKVLSSNSTEGYIEVTTLSATIEGKVLVLVNKGNNTIMRALRFEKGVMTILKDIYTMSTEGGTLEVPIRTNLSSYNVRIPQESQSWLRINTDYTRATMRDDFISLDISANMSNVSRSAIIDIIDEAGCIWESFTVYQSAQDYVPGEECTLPFRAIIIPDPDDSTKAYVIPNQSYYVIDDPYMQTFRYYNDIYAYNCFHYQSPLFTLPDQVDRLVMSVIHTAYNDRSVNSNTDGPYFNINEFYLYDAKGKEVELSTSDFDSNAKEQSEGSYEGLIDRNISSFFHSAWSKAAEPTKFYHNLSVAIPKGLKEFSIAIETEWNSNRIYNTPTEIIFSAVNNE